MIIRTLRGKPGCPFFVYRNFGTLVMILDILPNEKVKREIQRIFNMLPRHKLVPIDSYFFMKTIVDSWEKSRISLQINNRGRLKIKKKSRKKKRFKFYRLYLQKCVKKQQRKYI